MLADLRAVDSVQAMFAVIDKHRAARDWLRKSRPDTAATVDAAYRAEYDKWMMGAK